MSKAKTPTAIEKREQNRKALDPFALDNLKEKLPLILSPDPNLPPSPKSRYRSTYRYLGWDDLNEETIEVFSPFEISVRLFDYSPLEPLLAAQIYVDSELVKILFSWCPKGTGRKFFEHAFCKCTPPWHPASISNCWFGANLAHSYGHPSPEPPKAILRLLGKA